MLGDFAVAEGPIRATQRTLGCFTRPRALSPADVGEHASDDRKQGSGREIHTRADTGGRFLAPVGPEFPEYLNRKRDRRAFSFGQQREIRFGQLHAFSVPKGRTVRVLGPAEPLRSVR